MAISDSRSNSHYQIEVRESGNTNNLGGRNASNDPNSLVRHDGLRPCSERDRKVRNV